MLWFTGSQTVGCDCATELNWIHRSMHTIFTEAVHTCTHLYTHHLQWSNAHTQKKCHKKYLYKIEMKFVYCYDFSKKKNVFLGFPGGSVVESTCQCRRHRFNSWSRKNARAKEQLSPCTTAVEPVLWSPGATSC